MADPTIGQGFNQDIAFRYKPGQTQADFYSQKTGQDFGDPNALAAYLDLAYPGAGATQENVFSVLASGYRAQELQKITQNLNDFQNETFTQQSQPPIRASSVLQDSIDKDQSAFDAALKEFNDLKAKSAALTAPNYSDLYTTLRAQEGVPALEGDVANLSAARRNLPYTNRAASGNAGIETEAQLAANTQQKDIPLEIQQANALDRLKLAQDFINTSLTLKEKDYASSRDAMDHALDLVKSTIDLTRTHLGDLMTKLKDQQGRDQLNQQFAFENRITKPFYDLGGTVYRTSDRMPAHNQAEYIAMGGTGDFSDVQKISPQTKPFEVNPGNTLIDPSTGKVIYQAPFKPRAASGSSGGGASKPLPANDAAIRNWILANKRANPNVPYYDLWGQLADELTSQDLNPSNYNKLFWELLHPEGLAGYKKYVTNKNNSTSGGSGINFDQL